MSEQAKTRNDIHERLVVLRKLIREGEPSTQEELCEALWKKKFDVNQSTVSRDLRRIGAIKATNDDGEIIYRLPEDHVPMAPHLDHDISPLIVEITANESMIVVHTTPGSASLVALHLDRNDTALGILGTISGDDTIFIAPESTKKISKIIERIKDEYL